MDYLDYLVNSIGPRLTGSDNYTLACNFDGGTLKLPAAAPTGSTGNVLGDISLGTGAATVIYTTTIEDGGLILDTNGRDTAIRIHGTTSPRSIGSAASNGCFRMYNSHVMDLYNRVPIGTIVHAY